MQIQTRKFKLALVASGICFETVNLVTGEAQCVGFDLLVVGGMIVFESLETLNDVAPSAMMADVMQALDAAAQAERDSWQDNKAELRQWLDSRRN